MSPQEMIERPVVELLKLAAPYNPRKISPHDFSSLRLSLAKFGAVEPVVVNVRTNRLVGGHQRLKAADAEGFSTFPVVEVDLSETEERQLNIALNRIAGEWDNEKLIEVLDEIEAADGDLALTGFDDAELVELLGALEDEETTSDEENGDADDIPDSDSVEKRCEPGDIWILGPHRLLCGDSRKPGDVADLLGGRRIDLAFTSPPYASQRKYDEASGFRPICPDDYVAWFEDVQANVAAHISDVGSWFVNIKEAADGGWKQSYVKRLILAHIDDWGWGWVEEFCWPRPAMPLNPNTSRRFKNGWESVLHFARGTKYNFTPDCVRHVSDGVFKYSDQKAAGKMIGGTAQGVGGGIMSPVNAGDGLAFPSNVLANMGGAKVVGHSAAFPVGLPEFFIKAFSDPGDAVYDPFMGSGTTMIAAEKNERHAYGVEISPKYCDVILARWEKFTGLEAVLDVE